MINEKQRLQEERGSGCIISKLKLRMGNAYSKFVMDCLHAEAGSSSSAEEEFDDSLDVQETIVSTHQRLGRTS